MTKANRQAAPEGLLFGPATIFLKVEEGTSPEDSVECLNWTRSYLPNQNLTKRTYQTQCPKSDAPND